MAGFADRVLAHAHDPASLASLLTGPSAAPYPHLARLIDEVYATDGVEVEEVSDVSVLSVRPEQALAGADRISLTWQQQQPAFGSADVRGLVERAGLEVWADLYARLQLDVVTRVDPGGIDTVVTRAISNITSLADFRSRFRYLDLDALLARRRITTVEELRESAEYVLAEIRLLPAPAFDPTAAENRHTIGLELAIAVLGERDLVAGLRAAARLRAAGAAGPPGSTDATLGRPQRPFALAVVLPATADTGQPDDDAVDALFAAAGVLPLFAPP